VFHFNLLDFCISVTKLFFSILSLNILLTEFGAIIPFNYLFIGKSQFLKKTLSLN
jgi:hypothetical protein